MDITTVWNPAAGAGDYVLSAGDLLSGRDVETAVLISLLTDRLADDSDPIPDAPTSGLVDRRGWWGDTGEDRPIGSRLWLLDRRKGPMNLAQLAQDYAAEALQWMIDDGIVARFDIAAQWVERQSLYLTVTAYRSSGAMASKTPIQLW